MAAMASLISSKVWFLFIALTVVVVVGSTTTELHVYRVIILKQMADHIFGKNFEIVTRNLASREASEI